MQPPNKSILLHHGGAPREGDVSQTSLDSPHTHLLEAQQHLRVAQLHVADDGAARLQRLCKHFVIVCLSDVSQTSPTAPRTDDLIRLIAGEREAGRLRVALHRLAQRLLRAVRHRVGLRIDLTWCTPAGDVSQTSPYTTHLIEDDHLVAAGGQRDARLRERLDLVADHVDTTAISN